MLYVVGNEQALVMCIRFGLGCNIDSYIDLTCRITFETYVLPLETMIIIAL